MFNYGNSKLFLAKVLSGISFIIFSSFLIISFLTSNINDPGIGKLYENIEISNFFGYFGAISSSILLVFLGSFSLIIIFFIFFSGIVLVLGFRVKGLLIKFFLINMSVVCINFSLILAGVSFIKKGLLSEFLVNIFSYYLPFFVNQPIYKYLFISLLLIIALLF